MSFGMNVSFKNTAAFYLILSVPKPDGALLQPQERFTSPSAPASCPVPALPGAVRLPARITEGTIQKHRHLASTSFASLVPLCFWLSESVSPMDPRRQPHRTRQGRDWARGRGRGAGESFLRLQQGAIRLGNRKYSEEIHIFFIG